MTELEFNGSSQSVFNGIKFDSVKDESLAPCSESELQTTAMIGFRKFR